MRNAELMGQVPGAALPPVLCYHRVGGPLELGVTRIARSTFARQMKALARAGLRLRLALGVSLPAHVAVRRRGGRRARAVPRDAATPPRVPGGTGRRLSVRRTGRAGRTAGGRRRI